MLPYRDGQEIPPGYRLDERPRMGLVVGGLLTWGAAYAVGFAVAASNSFGNGTSWLAVPLVGPWAAIGARGNPCEISGVHQVPTQECVNAALNEASHISLLLLDGLVQLVGASLFVVGMAAKKKELVRKDVAGWSLVPVRHGTGGAGLQLRGAF